MARRIKLKVLRVSKNLTQEETAARLGVSRNMYMEIESGNRDGKHLFWDKVQQEFDIPSSEMWGIMHEKECEEPHNGNAVD